MIIGNDNSKTGLLLNANNIKLSRQYFRECVKLLGMYVLYRAPKEGKHYTDRAELDSAYQEPILVGCLFHEQPDQRTLKRIGWVSELQSNASLIEVDYDLKDLQQGALFIVPSAIDKSKGRLFRVNSMQVSPVYPSSVTCEIIPEYENTYDNVSATDFSHSSYNLLSRENEEEITYIQ